MSISYFARFLCLSLAAFFLANLVLTAIVSGVAARVVDKAGRISARDGARLLFAMRLAPAVLAGALVAGVCAPSYFWLEPRSSTEEIGLTCLLAAMCGAVCWTRSVARALSALVRVARMGASPALPLATSFLGDRDDLSARVERLLAGGAPETARRRWWPAIVMAVAITAIAVQPATFVAVHRALEALAH